jgi:hypothetical protein
MTPGFLAGRIVLQLLVFFGLCYSLFNRSPRIFAPIRTSQSFIVEKNSLQLSKTRISSSKQHDTNNDQGDIDSEDPYSEGFENQPEWLELFPRKRGEPELLRDYPDFVNLEPNDPLFLDMPWPTKAGPEATAFGKHMQWRRGLSDGESTFYSLFVPLICARLIFLYFFISYGFRTEMAEVGCVRAPNG